MTDADGRWVYRLSALGQLDGVPVLQNFYLVASPSGEQAVVAFSLNPKQADKLGARDLSFVGSLEVRFEHPVTLGFVDPNVSYMTTFG